MADYFMSTVVQTTIPKGDITGLFRAKVERLAQTLADPEVARAAAGHIRSLVGKVIL